MPDVDLKLVERLKISLFTRGIRLSPSAITELTRNGTIPLSVHEYATTGGITFVVDDDVYVNAPFDNAFCTDPEAELRYEADAASPFSVQFLGDQIPVRRVLPLPGFLSARDSQGNLATDTVFSHADRIRVSPVGGCAMFCDFCDIAGLRPRLRPVSQLLEAIAIAQADTELPADHLLISGGTPPIPMYSAWDETCAAIVAALTIPVDVMMPPRPTDPGFIDRLADFGVYGYSINIEVYDEMIGASMASHKQRIGHAGYAHAIERAVARTGGQGRVRSLILVGLEPIEQTLAGVEFLARLGCDPVLSPFRPTEGTRLADAPAPSYDMLRQVYLESREIVERHSVQLGPRCIPCQHNTLTFPDASGAYYHSSQLSGRVHA